MNCIICNLDTPYAFCKTHTPSYGEAVVLKDKKLVIYMGEIGFLHALKMKLRGYKPIRFWVGSDCLLLHKFPPGRGKLSVILHRIKAFLLGYIIESNFMDGNGLLAEIGEVKWLRLKNLEMRLWCGKHGVYPKQAHEGTNIGYYHPSNSVFARWKYGISFIENAVAMKHQLRIDPEEINWIKLDGKQDMSQVYPILDLLVRPSRHDGTPRMLLEAELNEIPVLYDETFSWTQEKFNQALLEAINKL